MTQRTIRKVLSKPARRSQEERRHDTESKLINAVGQVLASQGFAGLGVNAIAAAAGVDKVMIYRHFEGLPGLLRKYGESGAFWPTVDEVLAPLKVALDAPDRPSLAHISMMVLREYRRGLQRRPLTLEILAWESSSRNELTIVLEEVREDFDQRLFTELAKHGIVLPPIVRLASTLIGAAFNYLTFRGRDLSKFGALRLVDDESWAQIDSAVEAMIAGAFAASEPSTSETNETTRRPTYRSTRPS